MLQDDGQVLVKSGSSSATLSSDGITFQSGPIPFDHSHHRDHVLRGVWRITKFPRSGDICIWGGNTPSGDISFSDEMGAHSGWTDEEIQAFVLAPSHSQFDFSRITRHCEFYEYFSKRYGPWDSVPETSATVTPPQKLEVVA